MFRVVDDKVEKELKKKKEINESPVGPIARTVFKSLSDHIDDVASGEVSNSRIDSALVILIGKPGPNDKPLSEFSTTILIGLEYNVRTMETLIAEMETVKMDLLQTRMELKSPNVTNKNEDFQKKLESQYDVDEDSPEDDPTA